MNSKVQQYASLLGLTAPITFTEVKKAYRFEMLKWHPDLHAGKDIAMQVKAHQRAQAINEAYEFLSEITEKQPIPALDGIRASTFDDYISRHTYQNKDFRPGFPDPNAFEVFVKSSWVVSVGYNCRTQTLYLKLDRGVIYRCYDVPQSVFDGLLQATSVGRYIHQSVWRYRHEAC